MDAKLTTQTVRDILADVSGTEDDLRVDGIVGHHFFSQDKLEENRQKIKDLLAELPAPFQADGGGGMTFRQACYDKHGNHWAEHPTMDALFCLGIAIDAAAYLLPRDMWHIFPGGMPYVCIKDLHENHQQGS